MRRRWILLTVVLATVATGCSAPDAASPPTPSTSGPASSGPAPAPPTSRSPSATATGTLSAAPTGPPQVAGVVARDLEVPWAIAFLPDGSALVSERDRARIVHVPAGGGDARPVGDVPGVEPAGEGGLLGLAVSPDFGDDRAVFAYLTGAEDNRVVRMRFEDGRLSEPQVVLAGIRKAAVHNGGRIAFGPDGFLYVATGDAADLDAAQDKSSVNGKILRLTKDGESAPGNPFEGSPVWSYGHRNVQGLAWDSRGRLWASEFGQNEWDELNLIEKGRNYGWPVVEGPQRRDGFTEPQASWRPDEASPSGIAIVGDAVYLAGLRGARLWRVPVDGARAGEPRAYLTGEYGRLRSVSTAADGSLWLGTSNRDGRGDPREDDDKILRLAFG